MKLGAQDKDKIIRTGVISGGLLVVAIYGYLQLRTPDAPPPAPAPVVTTTSTVRDDFRSGGYSVIARLGAEAGASARCDESGYNCGAV